MFNGVHLLAAVGEANEQWMPVLQRAVGQRAIVKSAAHTNSVTAAIKANQG